MAEQKTALCAVFRSTFLFKIIQNRSNMIPSNILIEVKQRCTV